MQTELKRTTDVFTSGIVNVPQNTPAQLFFICDNQLELNHAIKQFNFMDVSFHLDQKRKHTNVISNFMLDNDRVQSIIANNLDIRKAKKLRRKTDYAYLFFELDDLDQKHFNQVLHLYQAYELPLFYHRTMRGWHFFSVKPLSKDLWQTALSHVKHLNIKCPHVTMRIMPNKWEGEKELWFQNSFVNWYDGKLHTDTLQFKKAVDSQDLVFLKKKYLLVTYRQSGEEGNL